MMMILMSIMPVMIGQVIEMAARMLCTSASSEAAGPRTTRARK